ncbi:hypothetical protein FQN54_008698 [Arachnomyces sp. PD_36]|nr:hypothetical protein FQN54_008698 [Arachnomyces sp. PD_36]
MSSEEEEDLIFSVVARVYSDIQSVTRKANSIAWAGIPDSRRSRATKLVRKAARNFETEAPVPLPGTPNQGLAVNPLASIAPSAFASLERMVVGDSQTRYIQFADLNGWMLLAICAHSDGFIWASRHVVDNIWFRICSLIWKNRRSIELFSKVRGLDWISVLPEEATEDGDLVRQDLGETLNVPTGDPFHWYVAEDGSTKQPFYAGKLQQTIPANFSTASNSAHELTPLMEIVAIGSCLLCRSTSFCSCNLVSQSLFFYPPLVELTPCSTRGLGIRALQPIREGTLLGEYLGEVFPATLPDGTLLEVDPTYALSMTSPGSGPVLAVIDSSEYGNWTRFINHSCRPSTIFFADTIARRLGMFVSATRDIGMFEELTIDYGDDYFNTGTMYCKCGEDCCRYPPPDTEQGEDDSKQYSEADYYAEIIEDSREYTDEDTTGDDSGVIDSGTACQNIGDDIETGMKSLDLRQESI